MMMTNTTMKKPPAPLDVPVLPTADDYRDGINKMRAKVNCPVLTTDEQAMADELLEFDATAQTHDDFPTTHRPSVDEYLKQQYQKNMLERYPNFEAKTETDIAALRHQMCQTYVFNMVLMLILAVLLVGSWLLFVMA